mmetsp:Transcript_36493/g.59029  ORF Transcript_36493/g.59029 Transcript_36493/m.59029 type:complete len:211 (-) Transcript_36493:1755-2387(-)
MDISLACQIIDLEEVLGAGLSAKPSLPRQLCHTHLVYLGVAIQWRVNGSGTNVEVLFIGEVILKLSNTFVQERSTLIARRVVRRRLLASHDNRHRLCHQAFEHHMDCILEHAICPWVGGIVGELVVTRCLMDVLRFEAVRISNGDRKHEQKSRNLHVEIPARGLIVCHYLLHHGIDLLVEVFPGHLHPTQYESHQSVDGPAGIDHNLNIR